MSSETPRAAVLAVYKERRQPTVNLKLVQSTTYRRADVLAATDEAIGCRQVEAIGQLQRNNLWEVVLKQDESKLALMHSTVIVKGVVAEMSELQKRPRKIRIIHVPCAFIVDKLRDIGTRVKQLGYEVSKHDGLLTNVRVGLIDERDTESALDVWPWSFDGLSGRGLLFVPGRPPKCRRCGDRSHKVAQCTAQRSYASAILGVTADDENDDDVVSDNELADEEKRCIVTDDQASPATPSASANVQSASRAAQVAVSVQISSAWPDLPGTD